MKKMTSVGGRVSMKMRVFMLVAFVAFTPIYAMQAMSLDDVAGETKSDTTQEEAAPSNTTVTNGDSTSDLFKQSGENALDNMQDSGDISAEMEGVSEFRSLAEGITAFVVQCIMVVLTCGLLWIVGLDLLYIVIPPLRTKLSGGQQGKAVAQNNGQNQMSMNNGISGGIGYNTNYNNGGGMVMNTQSQGNQGMGKCYVSEAALNAVASTQADNTGSVGVALKVWAKNTVIQLVAIPVIVTLLLTGVMQKIGYGIGSLINGFLSGIQF